MLMVYYSTERVKVTFAELTSLCPTSGMLVQVCTNMPLPIYPPKKAKKGKKHKKCYKSAQKDVDMCSWLCLVLTSPGLLRCEIFDKTDDCVILTRHLTQWRHLLKMMSSDNIDIFSSEAVLLLRVG